MNDAIDVRDVLPTIRVPTLILHRSGDRDVNVEEGRYIAARIPGAKFVELAGADHDEWIGDSESVVAEVEEFLTGVRPPVEKERVLARVLFTDIVGSTQRATALGDQRWRELLEAHNSIVRRELGKMRGREVKMTGDGVLATFDGLARAIRCARAISRAVTDIAIEIRAGVHTGECELMPDGDVGGIAIHIGARVLSKAQPSEVLVSRTVMDLVAGSGLSFEDRGAHALKGVSGEWHLFALTSDSTTSRWTSRRQRPHPPQT